MDRDQESVVGGGDACAAGGRGEPRRLVDDARVAPLALDELAESIEGRAGVDRALRESAPFVAGIRGAPQYQHFGGEGEGELGRVGGAGAAEDRDRLLDFVGIAAGLAERRVHGCQERDGWAAGEARGGNEALCQLSRLLGVLHERPFPNFHIEDEAVQPFGELLGEDRRHDEWDRLDGAGHVAERVEHLVGGGEVGGLPPHGDSDPADRGRELLDG